MQYERGVWSGSERLVWGNIPERQAITLYDIYRARDLDGRSSCQLHNEASFFKTMNSSN